MILTKGNSKLGREIYAFGIPAGDTCPGSSPVCRKHCYAKSGHYNQSSVKKSLAKKLSYTKMEDFVCGVVFEIRAAGAEVVRIHTSGDFYSPEYVRKWAEIVAACPNTRFFVYTRSWRVEAIRPELNKLARLENIRVWYSCDRDTGLPAKVGKRVRVAYMADGDDDCPPRTPDLGFRVTRKTVLKRISGAVVCPVENGTDAKNMVNCNKCGLCWEPLEVKDPRRFALPMA